MKKQYAKPAFTKRDRLSVVTAQTPGSIFIPTEPAT